MSTNIRIIITGGKRKVHVDVEVMLEFFRAFAGSASIPDIQRQALCRICQDS